MLRVYRQLRCFNSTIPRTHFFIISYFGFGFTSAYNWIQLCCLRRNVEPCCHTHDSRSTVIVYSAKARLVRLALYNHGDGDQLSRDHGWRLVVEYLHTCNKQKSQPQMRSPNQTAAVRPIDRKTRYSLRMQTSVYPTFHRHSTPSLGVYRRNIAIRFGT